MIKSCDWCGCLLSIQETEQNKIEIEGKTYGFCDKHFPLIKMVYEVYKKVVLEAKKC
jgi:hypothetical protein